MADESDESFEFLFLMLKESQGFSCRPQAVDAAPQVRRQISHGECVDGRWYRDYLELEPEEFSALFDGMLINVTGFFPTRWPGGHDRTGTAGAVVRLAGAEHVRVWSAPDATGEEAYSLAMVIARLSVLTSSVTVKICAFDLDERWSSAAKPLRRAHGTAGPDVPTGSAIWRTSRKSAGSGEEEGAFRRDLHRPGHLRP